MVKISNVDQTIPQRADRSWLKYGRSIAGEGGLCPADMNREDVGYPWRILIEGKL